MASQKMIAVFTFLVLFTFMEETKLVQADCGVFLWVINSDEPFLGGRGAVTQRNVSAQQCTKQIVAALSQSLGKYNLIVPLHIMHAALQDIFIFC